MELFFRRYTHTRIRVHTSHSGVATRFMPDYPGRAPAIRKIGAGTAFSRVQRTCSITALPFFSNVSADASRSLLSDVISRDPDD